jgi:hypothetical protein
MTYCFVQQIVKTNVSQGAENYKRLEEEEEERPLMIKKRKQM